MHRRSVAVLLMLAAASIALAPSALAGGQPFTMTLEGENEVPVTGDLDGTGTAMLTLNRGKGEVCWHISVSGITLPATAAHIHEAPAGQPGPIVVPLSPPTSGSSSGCTTASPTLIADIIENSEKYYVNVHNSEFPAGAVRGQLSNRGQFD